MSSSEIEIPAARTMNMSSKERPRRTTSCLTDRAASSDTCWPASRASSFPTSGLKELDLLVFIGAWFSLESRAGRQKRLNCEITHVQLSVGKITQGYPRFLSQRSCSSLRCWLLLLPEPVQRHLTQLNYFISHLKRQKKDNPPKKKQQTKKQAAILPHTLSTY